MSDIKTLKLIATMLPAKQSILLRGPTGIGKSAVVAQIAEELGMPMIDVRTAVMQEGDFNGIPMLERIRETGIASNAMYGWFVRACQEPVVLFLDEFPRAMMPVLQGTLQLVLDRALSNDEHGNPYELHPDTRIIAAGNFGAEYEGEDLDPAQLRRFLTVDLDPTTEEWLEWAKDRIDPVIRAFIQEHPKELRKDPNEVPGQVCANPAVWADLSRNLIHCDIAPKSWAGSRRPPGAYAIALGMIGPTVAGKFCDYVERYSILLGAKDILDAKDTKDMMQRVEDLDTADSIDVVDRVVQHLEEHGLKKSQLENLCVFMETIPAEIFMNLWATFGRKASENKKLEKVLRATQKRMTPRIVEASTASYKKMESITHATTGPGSKS
ncbi:MAG: AAA family ATPase [Planctomycetota bacterium]|jgi:midasin (ATPase involved in ribosome maturation)